MCHQMGRTGCKQVRFAFARLFIVIQLRSMRKVVGASFSLAQRAVSGVSGSTASSESGTSISMSTATTTPATERWNCHDHRDELKVSDFCAVYHPEHGVRCYGEHSWDVAIFHPVLFKDKAAAYKWIESGCIAEIQESFHNLNVCFTKQTLVEKVR